MASDASQLVLDALKADSGFTALVTSGAGNILDSGDMLVEVLSDAEEARRAAAGTGVLGVSVQDAGEVHLRGHLWRQTVVVRGLDRLNGFGAIRAIRFEAVKVLNNTQGPLDDGGVVHLAYSQRTGHRVDRVYNVDFEALTFVATVQVKEA